MKVDVGLVYWLILRFGQGEKGGRVGVWSGVLSWVNPSKLGKSALREKERERLSTPNLKTY